MARASSAVLRSPRNQSLSHSENRQPPLDEYATEASRPAARDHFVERFSLAQALLKAGISGAQVRRLVRSPTLELLLKYSPDQPRVPAGSGRTSGQWTTGATTGQPSGSAPGRQRPGSKHPVAAKPERYGRPKSKANPRPSAVPIALTEAPPSRQPSAAGGGGVVAAVSVDVLGPRNPGVDIGSLSEAALSGLAAFLRGLAISPAALAGAAVGGFGLSLIPTNAPLGRTVKLPGPGNVSVFQELDEPGLTFRYTTVDGVQHEWMAAPAAGGVYLGPDG